MTPATKHQHIDQESLGGAARATGTPAMSGTLEDGIADPQGDKQRANTGREMRHGYGPERGRLDPQKWGGTGNISVLPPEKRTWGRR